MKTSLLDIKNQYAQEQGYKDWVELYRRAGFRRSFKHENEVFILVQKAALEKGAGKAKIIIMENSENCFYTSIDCASITNPENLIR